MMDDLLRRRGVSEIIIRRLQKDGIDVSVIPLMSEEDLKQYLPKYGDRIAVTAFAKQQQELINTGNLDSEKKRTLKEKLIAKLQGSEHKKRSASQKGNMNAKKKSRKIEIGWLHSYGMNGALKQVRSPNGGGTRTCNIDIECSIKEVLPVVWELFFPDGISKKGTVEDFQFFMADATHDKLDENLKVKELLENTKMKQTRMYMVTLPLSLSNEPSIDQTEKNGGNVETFAGGYDDASRNASTERNVEACRNGKSLDLGCIETDMDVELAETASQNSMLSNISEPGEILIQSNGAQSLDYDIAVSDEAEHSRAQGGLNAEQVNQNMVQGVLNAEQANQNMAQGGVSTEQANQNMVQCDHSREEVNQNMVQGGVSTEQVNHMEQPTLVQQEEVDYLEDFLRRSEDIPSDPDKPDIIRIHRAIVLNELIPIFKDLTLISRTLQFIFVNERGHDSQGLSNDVYAAFWQAFCLKYTDGEDFRVPVLSNELGDTEWEAVGRILMKGYNDLKYFPMSIAPAFFVAVCHGESAVSGEILKSSFLSYLSATEKEMLEHGLSGAEYDQDELIDLLDTFECHSVPNQENLLSLILQIAHKKLIQEPKYAMDALQRVGQSSWIVKFPSVDSILEMYEELVPTVPKVLALFSSNPVSKEQNDSMKYLQKFVRGRNKEQLKHFLRFLTGSDMLCVPKIDISFVVRTGAGRVPTAHTCGPVLELPSTYVSYPDFGNEWDTLLKSEENMSMTIA